MQCSLAESSLSLIACKRELPAVKRWSLREADCGRRQRCNVRLRLTSSVLLRQKSSSAEELAASQKGKTLKFCPMSNLAKSSSGKATPRVVRLQMDWPSSQPAKVYLASNSALAFNFVLNQYLAAHLLYRNRGACCDPAFESLGIDEADPTVRDSESLTVRLSCSDDLQGWSKLKSSLCLRQAPHNQITIPASLMCLKGLDSLVATRQQLLGEPAPPGPSFRVSENASPLPCWTIAWPASRKNSLRGP